MNEIIAPTSFRRISWGAIFAGTVVALMVSLILGLAGVAVGAATIHPTTEANPMEGVGIGAAIWWFVMMVISLFVAGWVAARLAGIPRRVDGMLHGVTTWGFVTLIVLFALGSTVGGILSGTANFLAGGLSAAAQAFNPNGDANEPSGADRQNSVLKSVKQEAKTLLRQTGKPELQPQALKSEATQAVNTAKSGIATAAKIRSSWSRFWIARWINCIRNQKTWFPTSIARPPSTS
jgi:hypothetical protein